MAFVLDAALDALHGYVADNCDRVDLCTAEPATYAGVAAVSVANYALTLGAGNGDWTILDGAVSGRSLRLEAQTGSNGTATGDADFFAGTDGTATLLVTGAADGDTVNNGSPANISQSVVLNLPDFT